MATATARKAMPKYYAENLPDRLSRKRSLFLSQPASITNGSVNDFSSTRDYNLRLNKNPPAKTLIASPPAETCCGCRRIPACELERAIIEAACSARPACSNRLAPTARPTRQLGDARPFGYSKTCLGIVPPPAARRSIPRIEADVSAAKTIREKLPPKHSQTQLATSPTA